MGLARRGVRGGRIEGNRRRGGIATSEGFEQPSE